MANEPALRSRREVLDYNKPGAAAGSGGSYMKVFIRLRPSDASSIGELPYTLPEAGKICVQENREPFPTEHQFSFHRVYDKETPQDVSSARRRGRRRGVCSAPACSRECLPPPRASASPDAAPDPLLPNPRSPRSPARRPPRRRCTAT